MPKVSDAIKNFLSRIPHNCPEMATWYNDTMEVQVLVAAGNGEPVPDKRNTWTDGIVQWSHIRMPRNADTEPIANDFEIRFPLHDHVEFIGLTGWNFKQRKSIHVGFDFDAITQHGGSGISDEELIRVREALEKIPQIGIYHSTGGLGIHAYLFFDPNNLPETANHHEHAALARACLGSLSNIVNFPFEAALDVCGGMMWVYGRKMAPENSGLALIKKSEGYFDPPIHWKDHISVIVRKRNKVQIRGVPEDEESDVESMAASRRTIPLDSIHRKIIEELQILPYSTYWVSDHNLLQTHTCALEEVFKIFTKNGNPLQGLFQTISPNTDPGKPNCFCFPLSNGAFKVIRFGNNAPEHESWCHDSKGWTYCYFNRKLDLPTASSVFGGLENHLGGGGFTFPSIEGVMDTIKSLGGSINVPRELVGKQTTLRTHKDGRIIVEIKCKDDGNRYPGFIYQSGKYTKILNIKAIPPELEEDKQKFDLNTIDQMVRALLTSKLEEAGWALYDEGKSQWPRQNKDNVRSALKAQNYSPEDVEKILGHSILKAWTMINRPFEPELPGNRQWNIDAAQFKFTPMGDGEGTMHPHWDLILSHCGEDLTLALKANEWARKSGIVTGKDYLLYWISAMFRFPFEPLPYLFFFGPQNSGKSIFHEALSLLVKNKVGIVSADVALTNSGSFNGELANAFLCVVEETDLSRDRSTAYNKLKDWVVSPTIAIHAKRVQVYNQENTTHWIQCANDRNYCPIFPGDTRITMSHVPALEEEIPKNKLLALLENEAAYFMATIMSVKLPVAEYRLRIPAIMTSNKEQAASSNSSPLETFLKDYCFKAQGQHLSFKVFVESFMDTLPSLNRQQWTEKRIQQEIPVDFPVGRYTGNKQCIGNISMTESAEENNFKFAVQDGKLIKILL